MSNKKRSKFHPKDGQLLADKYKFKPIHLLVFAIVLLIVTLIATRKGSLTSQINLPSTDKNQGSAVEDKERIEISGVKVADFIDKTNGGTVPSYYTISQSADYHIFYITADNLFFISITSYPFDKHRSVAEQNLIDALAISKDDACKLNVDITTPAYANPDKAGEIYGLSFCE